MRWRKKHLSDLTMRCRFAGNHQDTKTRLVLDNPEGGWRQRRRPRRGRPAGLPALGVRAGEAVGLPQRTRRGEKSTPAGG